MIRKKSFNSHCINEFIRWFHFFRKCEYLICDEIANKHIVLSKEILINKTWGKSESENNIAFISGVLFKGLTEFVQLAKITADKKWHLEPKRTEDVWTLLWNCRDRFNFCSNSFQANEFNWIKTKINELNENFILFFGHGIYSSPEIFIKKELCGICNLDTRKCSHINGNLYNGVMCYTIPQEISLHSISLVTVPRDPRCRLWSWNRGEDGVYKTAILVSFQIDDWLRNNE